MQGNKAKIMIIGDLHISDRYNGKHVDYLQNCIDVLSEITDKIWKNDITHVILLGDLIGIGMNEKNLQYRDTLLYLMKLIQKWKMLSKNPVYVVRGNHDIGDKLTDFEMFVSLGLLEVVDSLEFDFLKLHMLGYGDEHKEIEVNKEKYNVALMHANVQIEGLTDWYRGGAGVELSELENLYGIDLVVAGHIHNPSPRLVQTSIKDKEVGLFYPGCPTRPRYEPHIWESAFAVVFTVDEDGVDLQQVEFSLKPSSEIFTKTYDDIEDEEELVADSPTFSIDELAAILEELQAYNLVGGNDYTTQVNKMAGLDREAAELALKYIDEIMSS